MTRATMLTSILGLIFLAGCATAPDTVSEKQDLEARAAAAVERIKIVDMGVEKKFFQTARGYAVFPSIGKGGLGIGGAYGKGVLYERGRVVGYCDLSLGTVGFQAGGQAYTEVIFFQNDLTLLNFKSGTFAFDVNASVVAATADASANTDYDHGVIVFTVDAKGLMGEASLGAQKFSFVPK